MPRTTKGAQYALSIRVSVKPEVAFSELERIRKAKGGLRPSDIVEAAVPEDAPLHPAFEWDDEKASHQYRLMQARRLVRAVTVSVADADDPRSVYVHVAADGNGTYEPMEAVVGRVDLFAIALAELERKLEAAQKAVDELKRLAGAGDDPERSSRLIVAVEAFRAAQAAVRSLH